MMSGGAARAQVSSIAPGHAYRAFGLTVRSCLPLPAPDALPGASIDVTVRYGAVDPDLPHAVTRQGFHQASPDALLLSIDGIARYLVTRGREIVVDRHAGASDEDVRLFLLGSAVGALLHQRHDLVLHGSAIDIGPAAVAFLGPSGSGKSTLAAAFQRRGFAVLTDDLCVVRADAHGAPCAQPGFPQMKLWKDALDRLEIASDGLPRVGAGLHKRALPVSEGFASRALPLARLYVLHANGTDDVELTALTGSQKFMALMDHTYRSSFLEGLGTRAAHFQHAVAIARATAMLAVHRPGARFCLDELVDRLVADFAGPASAKS